MYNVTRHTFCLKIEFIYIKKITTTIGIHSLNMKIQIYLLISLLIFNSIEAHPIKPRDSSMNSNFWIKLCVNTALGNTITGSEYITSGKNAATASAALIVTAINEIIKGTCYLDRSNNYFSCAVDKAWKSANWMTWVNVEFDMFTTNHVVDNFIWKGRDNACGLT